MSVGLGILFGSVFLGLIILYLGTKGTWNWGKIIQRSITVIGVLVALVVLAGIGRFANEKWQKRPTVVTFLYGVSLGEKFSDVVFRNGSFEKIPVNKDIRRKHDDEDVYVQRETRLRVHVRNSIVSAIAYRCNADVFVYDYTEVNRIRCGNSGDEIKELFGGKVRVLCPKAPSEGSELRRVFDVVEYGTRYLMRLNRVEGFYISDKQELKSLVGINWDKCI